MKYQYEQYFHYISSIDNETILIHSNEKFQLDVLQTNIDVFTTIKRVTIKKKQLIIWSPNDVLFQKVADQNETEILLFDENGTLNFGK